MLQAALVESSVSVNERLYRLICEESWACVPADGALRRLCERRGVETRFASASRWTWSNALAQRRAVALARQNYASNPLQIEEPALKASGQRWRTAGPEGHESVHSCSARSGWGVLPAGFQGLVGNASP